MEIQAASRSEKASLGQGYDAQAEDFVGQCVRGDLGFVGQTESTLSFDRSMSVEQTHRELGFDVGVKVRYGLFSGSAAAQYANSATSSEFSDVSTYSHVLVSKNAKMDFDGVPDGLTPAGLAAKGTPTGPEVGENWGRTCGQEFVSQITLGAKLFVSIAVEFATREDKESFAAQFSFSGPPVDVKADLEMASREFGKRASLTLHAYQLGGDVRKLPQVFGTGPGTPPILTASLGNPDSVLAALDAAVTYAKNDFVAQIDPALPLDSPFGQAQLSYITSPYAELGLFSPDPIITAAVREARRLLSEEFEQNARYQRRLSRILNGPIRLSSRQLEKFTGMQRDVAKNLALIQEAVEVCYRDFTQASAKVAETVEQLKDFVAEEFDVQPESFAQWWDMKDLPQTLQRDRQTLLDIAAPFIPQFVDFPAIEDQGLALQQELARLDGPFPTQVSVAMFTSRAFSVLADSKVRELDLVDLDTEIPFASLAPVRHTPLLTSLSVLADRPSTLDLDGLGALTDLAELKISDMPVTSLAPLQGLTSLVRLSVSGPVEDLGPLTTNAFLEELTVDDAEVTDLAPLAGLTRLREVFLRNSPVTTVAPFSGLTRLVSFEVGRPGTAVEGMAELVERLGATSFFSTDAVFTVSERGGDGILDPVADTDVVWTRQGSTTLFDTVTRPAAGGATVPGSGAFAGVQSAGDDDDLLGVVLMQRRDNVLYRYLAVFAPGATAVEDGMPGRSPAPGPRSAPPDARAPARATGQ